MLLLHCMAQAAAMIEVVQLLSDQFFKFLKVGPGDDAYSYLFQINRSSAIDTRDAEMREHS